MKNERPDKPPRLSKPRKDHSQRNQRKGSQAMNREQEPEKLTANKMGQGLRDRQPQQETYPRRVERAGVSLLHRGNLSSPCRRVKADFRGKHDREIHYPLRFQTRRIGYATIQMSSCLKRSFKTSLNSRKNAWTCGVSASTSTYAPPCRLQTPSIGWGST